MEEFDRLSDLILEEVQKWRLLKKIHHTELVKSVEKVQDSLEPNGKEMQDLRFSSGHLELVGYVSRRIHGSSDETQRRLER